MRFTVSFSHSLACRAVIKFIAAKYQDELLSIFFCCSIEISIKNSHNGEHVSRSSSEISCNKFTNRWHETPSATISSHIYFKRYSLSKVRIHRINGFIFKEYRSDWNERPKLVFSYLNKMWMKAYFMASETYSLAKTNRYEQFECCFLFKFGRTSK